MPQFVNEETGQLYADGVFSKFVSVGEEVPADATIVNFFLPLSCRSTAVQAALYASDDPAPVSVHDAGTVRLGNISVGVPKFTGAGRPIEVSFRFGDAAIAVEAHDMTGGAKKTVSISFECAFV